MQFITGILGAVMGLKKIGGFKNSQLEIELSYAEALEHDFLEHLTENNAPPWLNKEKTLSDVIEALTTIENEGKLDIKTFAAHLLCQLAMNTKSAIKAKELEQFLGATFVEATDSSRKRSSDATAARKHRTAKKLGEDIKPEEVDAIRAQAVKWYLNEAKNNPQTRKKAIYSETAAKFKVEPRTLANWVSKAKKQNLETH